jgi:FkbM family methyltransferase
MRLLRRILRYGHRVVTRPLGVVRMRLLGIRHFPPNYVYFDRLGPGSIVVDVGCGYEAEFSRHVIDRYGVRAIGVDPTRKHEPFLKDLERRSGGRFRHVPLAVTPQAGQLLFYESTQNESGSILATHTNVQHDDTTAYTVESVSLRELGQRLGVDRIDYLKLDLEGAEYGLFDAPGEELRPFEQIFLECHHHCTQHTFAETKALVRRVRRAGFRVFTLDRHNFLFYRDK